MRVTFAGVGAAFDERLPNTSLLIQSSRTSLLADCGFTAAPAFWRVADAPLSLDALHLSHFHGDHYFGVPHLLLRMREKGRTQALTIFGQTGVEERISTLMDMAYPNLLAKAQFGIRFRECSPERKENIKDMRYTFALSDHPMPCLSLRVDTADHSVFYSGDGRPTDATRALARGCELVVHESFSLEPDTPGHGTVQSSIDFARQVGAKTLALVHCQPETRHQHRDIIMETAARANDLTVLLPEPGDCIDLNEQAEQDG